MRAHAQTRVARQSTACWTRTADKCPSRGSGDETELDCFSIQAALRPETRRLYGVTPARLRKVVSGGARGGDARGCGDSRRRRRGQRLGEPVAEGRARATALPRPFFSETTIDGARLAS